MAFSKTPVNSTYQQKMVSLWAHMDSRGTTPEKDAYGSNVYPELVQNKVTGEKDLNVIKRAGSSDFIPTQAGGATRGAFLWKEEQKLFVAVQNNIYVYNSDTGATITTLNAVFGTVTGHVDFIEFNYETNEVKLVATDGTKLVTIDKNNLVVPCVDADLPVHKPYLVSIDGYVFVVKVGSADIYNSDLNDPLSWSSGDFITAEMRPDELRRIALLNNYIVAFGSKSIEYFYDAANVSGSPLSRNDSAVKSVGYCGGFAQYGNQIYFIGETSESSPDVFLLEDFKITPVGTDAVRRHLSSVVGAAVDVILSTIVSFDGHDFYTMHTGNYTYVMEIETKLWAFWTYKNTGSFPIIFSFLNYGASGYKNLFIMSSNSAVMRFDSSLGQDSGTSFPAIIVGDNQLFDSYNNKFAGRLIIWGDQPNSSLPVVVQWSDDDYKTWETGQIVDLFQELPSIRRGGRFRRRAYRLSYTGPLPWRINKIELDINLGTT